MRIKAIFIAETCMVGGYSMPLENTCTVYTCMCICMYVHIRINYNDTWLHYTSMPLENTTLHVLYIQMYMYVYMHVCTYKNKL